MCLLLAVNKWSGQYNQPDLLHHLRYMTLLPRTYAQGIKQSVCPSVVVIVVVIGTKIARSRVLGICACCNYNQSVDNGENLVCMPFELLKKVY